MYEPVIPAPRTATWGLPAMLGITFTFFAFSRTVFDTRLALTELNDGLLERHLSAFINTAILDSPAPFVSPTATNDLEGVTNEISISELRANADIAVV